MACLTRCVLSWETNRRCEPAVHDGNPWRLNAPFSQGPNSRFELAGAHARGRCDRITSPQSRIEARLLFCPVSFGDDPEARPPCRRQTSDRRQSVDRISALVCPLFRSKLPFICSFITETIRVSDGHWSSRFSAQFR